MSADYKNTATHRPLSTEDLGRIALVAAAYFAAHLLAFMFPDSARALMAVWPAGGIGLAALLLNRRRLWPALLSACFLAGNLANALGGRPFLRSLGYMTANILETLACALLITAVCGANVRFARVKEVLALVCAATLVNGCTSLLGAGAARLESTGAFWRFYWTWWVSDGLGILVLTPLIVSWHDVRIVLGKQQWKWVVEYGLFLALWCALAWQSFTPDLHPLPFNSRPYFLVALLSWPALRFGQRGNTLALAVLAVIAVTSESALTGPLLWGGTNYLERLLQIQIFIGCACLTGLLVAANRMERNRSEESLGESERLYADLYNDAPDMCLSVDIATKAITQCNRTLERLTGYTREEIIGQPVTNLLCAESLDEERRLHETMRLYGEAHGHEVVVKRKNGSPLHVAISATAIRDEYGRPLRSRAVWRDITERHKAEAALRDAFQFNEQVIDSARDGVIVYGSDLRYRVWNRYMEELSGVSAKDVLGRRPLDVFPFLRDVGMVAKLEKILAGGPPETVDFPYSVPQSGRSGWASDLSAPLLNGDGEIVGVIAVVRDITERIRAQREQDILAKIYRSFLTGSAEDMYGSALRAVLDAFDSEFGVFGYIDGQGDLVSPSMTRRVWDQCQATDKRVTFAKDEWGNIVGGNSLLSRISAFSNESFKVPEGQPPINNYLTAPIVFGGQPIGVLTVANRPDGYRESDRNLLDVIANNVAPVLHARLGREQAERERERLRDQLLQSQKMESVGRLAGGVAHDFNNLLTVINGFSELVLSRMGAGEMLRHPLEEIHKAGERAAGLTRQLLAFSRKQVLQPSALALNDVVEDMRSMLQRLTGEDVEVHLVLSPERPSVFADPHQLEQVIMNLAVNARDAMPRGGRLIIETALMVHQEKPVPSRPEVNAGRYAVLAVSDTGLGMDEATRKRIFEPFFTTKRIGEGTGLGLSTVQGIVEQSGGYIEVHSELGHGSTFRIHLPALAEQGAAPVEPPAAVTEARGSETILVVEDQEEVRSYAAAVLQSYGYQVIEAVSAGEALQICEREGARIDMVLTDVVMPHTSGRELVELLAKMQPGIQALFMSGYIDSVVERHGVVGDATHFIQKPFSPAELAHKVRTVLST